MRLNLAVNFIPLQPQGNPSHIHFLHEQAKHLLIMFENRSFVPQSDCSLLGTGDLL